MLLRDGVAFDGCARAWAQGLREGMPRRQVLRQIPGALLADCAGTAGNAVARAVWDACARHTPYVEILEPHRLFLGLPVPGRAPPASEAAALAAELDAAAGGGTVVMAGLATGKLVARAAAGTAAPGAGPVAVPAGDEAAFLAPLPVKALWRARPEILARLDQLGLARVADLARVPEAELLRQFGPGGRDLARWARGYDPEPVRAGWPPREVAWREAFPGGAEPAALPAVLSRCARELARGLRARDEVCHAVSLALEREGAGPLTGRRQLPRRQQTAFALEQALLGLFRGLWAGAAPHDRCTALTVTAADLAPAAWRQLDLWGQEERRRDERTERLEQALAAVRARFPPRAARIGLPEQATPRREAMYRFYDPFRWLQSGRLSMP